MLKSTPRCWYRRALACDRINEFDECLEAIEKLEALNQDVIDAEDINKLKERAVECAQELQDDRDGKMMEQMKKGFDEVVEKYDLKNDENAGMLADLIVSAGDMQVLKKYFAIKLRINFTNYEERFSFPFSVSSI